MQWLKHGLFCLTWDYCSSKVSVASKKNTHIVITPSMLFLNAGFVPHLPEIRIVLLGQIDAGKSSTGNTILGREEFQLTQHSDACVMRQREVFGKHVTVVEAPGWSRNSKIGKKLLQQIALNFSPHVFLLVIRSDRSFTEDQKNSFQYHLKQIDKNLKCEQSIWSQTIVLFTCGEWLGYTFIEQYIESEGTHIVWLLGECGERYHVFKNRSNDKDRQVKDLLEKIEDLVINRCVQNGELQYGFGLSFSVDIDAQHQMCICT